jgi:hypothetical protein
MSSKARALFKKLRSKLNEEREKERNETPEQNGFHKSESCPMGDRKQILVFPKATIKEKEEEIDPLDYFKTEHIKIEPSDMKEYDPVGEIKESDGEKSNRSKDNKKSEVIIDTKTGVVGPTSHKINFMEMMKARNKIKKTEESMVAEKKHVRKNLSVQNKKIKKEEKAEDVEEEEKKKKEERKIKVKSVEKNKEDNTQSLYVKLILARNRFNQNTIVTEENVFKNIMELVDEINSVKDLPQEISDEVNNLLKKLEFPTHLIIDNDVQDYISEDKFVPLISNPMPLDQVLKKLNLTEM